MVITAYTTVVVTVSIALHVTKRLVIVTEGVIRVILMVTVAKVNKFTDQCIQTLCF